MRTVDTVEKGDVITLNIDEDSGGIEPNGSLEATAAFENEAVVIFDKPAKMPVHPSARHRTDTLGNLFAARYPGLMFRPVNRLDKDTSGLCAVAKDPYAAALMQGSCKKVYYAAVHGKLPETGTISAPIARERESIITRCVRTDGQEAVTHYRKIAENSKYTLVEIELETGRTHQIRVHFSYLGNPLAGDDLYGGSREDISRQALHCGRMTFTDPITKERKAVESPLPNDIKKLFAEEKNE